RRCPEARMVHFRGGSAPVKALARARARLPAYYYSSRTRFFYQAYGYPGLWAANILWTLGRWVAVSQRLIGRRRTNVKEAEIRDIWINSLKPLGPRYAPSD
ncbi:MAG: glycosyltransferase family 2 protein, partial [Pseudomonadota bacterium]